MSEPGADSLEAFSAFDRLAAAILAAGGLALLLSFSPLQRPVLRDPATWDYMSVELAAGVVPYRDIFLHKTPGGALIGALGAVTGPALGLTPLEGAHFIFLCLGALGPALLYLLCRRRLAAAPCLAIAIFMMACDQWPLAAIEGVRPKVATVDFGLACLLMAGRGRLFAAGAFGALSTLCWQPGIAFFAGALVAVARAARTERVGAVLRLAAGAAVPVVIVLAALSAAGALDDFFAQAVLFNLDYIQTKARAPAHILRTLYNLTKQYDAVELLLAPAALIGIWRTRNRVPAELCVFTAAYALLALIDFQRWPDTILFVPFIAAVAGAGMHGLLRAALARREAAIAACVVALLAAATTRAPGFWLDTNYEQQGEAMAQVAKGLGPNDTVVAVSAPEFLLHLGMRNGWKWPYMWFGVDRFAADRSDGGFEGLLRDLESKDPKLILIGRRWTGPLRARFERWAADRYRRSVEPAFPHVHPGLAVYRRKAPQDPA